MSWLTPGRAATAPSVVPTLAPALVLAAALLLTACSGVDDSDATPKSPSSSSSASPSTSPGSTTPSAVPSSVQDPSPPFPAAPAGRTDRRGQKEFAQYVLQAWIYALNTNDPRALLQASGPKPCDGCSELVAELRGRAREGWYVDLSDVRVSRVDLRAAGGRTAAVLRVAIPESTSYNADGTFRSTSGAHPRSTFTVEMAAVRGSLRLLSFRLVAGG